MKIKDEDMKKILSRLPEEPKDIDDWIREQCVAVSYLIYNSRTGRTVCTRCGCGDSDGKYYAGQHGIRMTCPWCGEEVIALAEGRGRQTRSEWFRLLTWTRKGRTVYGRLWEIEASFEDPGLPKLKKWLSALYIVNAKGRRYFKHKPFVWGWNPEWEEYKTFRLPAPPGGMGYGWQTKYEFTYMRTDNLEQVFTKSDLKYLWVPGWCTNLTPEAMVQYIGFGIRQQSIELMTKAGFTKLVMERLHGTKSGHIINWQGKSLERILRQPKRHVRMLQKMNATTTEVYFFRQLTEEEREIVSGPLLRALPHWSNAESLRKRINKITPFAKWLKYMNGQVTEDTGVGEYLDYIEMCKKAGKDIHSRKVIFPENLKEAHDRAVIEYKTKQDARKTAAIRAMARQEEYRTDLLTILPGDTQEKLNLESAILHHCVKTYGDRIAAGKCWIWFIRKIEDPEHPYYTMETDTKGKMIQCRGLKNCTAPPDVEWFAESFSKYLQETIRKERESA